MSAYDRGEFGSREIADRHDRRILAQEAMGMRGKRIFGEQRDENANIEVEAQRSSSSRILLTSSPAFSFADNLLIRRAASQSRSSAVTGRGVLGFASNSTTGLPCRVITTSSPFRARSMSSGNRFLASATLWVLIPEI